MKDKESTTLHAARAREKFTLPPVIDIHTPPTLELLLAYAEKRGYTDTKWVRKWHDVMSNEYFWCFPKSGEPIKHWPAYFRSGYLEEHASDGRRQIRGKSVTVRPTNFLEAGEDQRKEFTDGLA